MQDITKVPEIDISYKNPVPVEDRIKIATSKEAVELMRLWWDRMHPGTVDYVEHFAILLMNHCNHVLGAQTIGKGGVVGTVVDVRVVAQHAIKANAVHVILCHNHPSGNVTPSDMDNNITKEICNGLKLLGIQVMDHVIITADSTRYYSFADEGLVPD